MFFSLRDGLVEKKSGEEEEKTLGTTTKKVKLEKQNNKLNKKRNRRLEIFLEPKKQEILIFFLGIASEAGIGWYF